MKIGLFFGSFNPVTDGHIEVINESLKFVDKIIVIVSPQNPSKSVNELADFNHRYKMVELSLRNIQNVEVSDIEIHMSKPSYTYDTLQSIMNRNDEYYYITGSDSLNGIKDWKEGMWILSNLNFICFLRDNLKIDKNTYDIIQYKLTLTKSNSILSSSLIRKMVLEDRKISHLVPNGVSEYIDIFGLYK